MKKLIGLLLALVVLASVATTCGPSPQVKEAIQALGDENWEVRRDAALAPG